jgi:hypothetical protein
MASQRHVELRDNPNFWGDIKQAGGKVVALSAGRIDAMRIIRHIVGNNCKMTLALQRQLIEEQRQIAETDAGLVIWESISVTDSQEINERIQKTVDEVEKEISRSRSKDGKALQDIRSKFGEVTNPFDEDVASLKVGFRELREIWDERLKEDHEMFWREVARIKSAESEHIPSICASESASIMASSTYSSASRQSLRTQDEPFLANRYRNSQKGKSSHLTAVSAVGAGLAAGQLIAAVACTMM